MVRLVEKNRIASLIIRVAWNVGLGSMGAVGSVGAASVTPTSRSTALPYSHSSSVSVIVGRDAGGGTDGVGLGGGGFRRAGRRGIEPAAALFAEVRGYM